MLAPHAPETLATLDVDELRALLESPRGCRSSTCARRPSATAATSRARRNIPYRLLRKLGCGALDRSKPVVTVCESGPRAAIAASLLQREGFDVRAVADGGIADFADTVAFSRCGA